MNYFDAQKILNAVRDGAEYPLATINRALEMTGDLDERHMDAGVRSEGMDRTLQKKVIGIWCSRSPRLVEPDDSRHRETQGETCGRSTAKGDE